jgi:protein phosphatase
MGTTIVVVIFRNDQTWRAHVGDSRLYRLRNSKLEQISQDHTWISQAIRAGEITLEEAKTHPWRHVLSQCLGRKDLYDGIDIFTMDVEPGDRFVLCSDGLTEEVEFDLICKSLGKPETVEKAAETLIQEAKNGGGSDNITVVVIEALANEALNDEPLTNEVLAGKALTDEALTDKVLTDEVLVDKVLPNKARRIK